MPLLFWRASLGALGARARRTQRRREGLEEEEDEGGGAGATGGGGGGGGGGPRAAALRALLAEADEADGNGRRLMRGWPPIMFVRAEDKICVL